MEESNDQLRLFFRPVKRATFKIRHFVLRLLERVGYERCNSCPGSWQKWVMTQMFPNRTGLPMTVFVGIKVEPELPRLTVSQLHGNSICRYREWFTVSIPEKEGEEPKRWGRQGEITDAELEKVKFWTVAVDPDFRVRG
ncbi:hypothetical protein WJX75_004359 [Coccomyxa subellipsoidea]|uniref:N-acetyltransferase domain-containing protein n=1 Tax=Coccomyxa subellipsoidea TaxID=248742 RepID=A0ABR2Z2T6_9CHLO